MKIIGLHLIHQVDIYQGKETANVWHLVGVNKRQGKELKKAGWIWLPGPQGGGWITDNKNNQVSSFIDIGVKVIENITRNN